MAKGISIHIGINQIDSNHYDGWNGELFACEYDAKDIESIAKTQGFESKLFLTQNATYAAVKEAIIQAATQLKKGDILLITYSGYGGQLPPCNGEETENRNKTWILYDRQLVDDELYYLWTRFQKGVRIVMLSDTCHNSSLATLSTYQVIAREFAPDLQPRFRTLPREILQTTYYKYWPLYDDLRQSYPTKNKAKISASVLMISACLDNQLSSDGENNGLFTAALLEVWYKNKYRGGYHNFYQQILCRMPPWESPHYLKMGMTDLQFDCQTPFTI